GLELGGAPPLVPLGRRIGAAPRCWPAPAGRALARYSLWRVAMRAPPGLTGRLPPHGLAARPAPAAKPYRRRRPHGAPRPPGNAAAVPGNTGEPPYDRPGAGRQPAS